MNVMVVGCGSIGERHISNILNLYPDFDLMAMDISPDRGEYIKKTYNINVFDNLLDAFSTDVDIYLICTPPNTHISLALRSIENGAHVFIEKPLSHNTDSIDDLIKKAAKNDLFIYVGYCFRFDQGLTFVKDLLNSEQLGPVYYAQASYGQYLPDWRPWQDYKLSYTSKIASGGGIILDSSHEIDYLRWFFGEIIKVFSVFGKIGPLEIETEDFSLAYVRFENDVIGIIRQDMLRKDYSRTCEIVCEKGTISWNFQDKTVKVFNYVDKNLTNHSLAYDTNDMYLNEIKHVFENIINRENESQISGINGLKTLEAVNKIKENGVNA
jgi:predicted dehydrogenase